MAHTPLVRFALDLLQIHNKSKRWNLSLRFNEPVDREEIILDRLFPAATYRLVADTEKAPTLIKRTRIIAL